MSMLVPEPYSIAQPAQLQPWPYAPPQLAQIPYLGMASQLAVPALQNSLGPGYPVMGFAQGNLYNLNQQQLLLSQNQQAMRYASTTVDPLVDLMRSGSRARGHLWGDAQESLARDTARNLMLSSLTLMGPGNAGGITAADYLLGGRNPMVLAHHMHLAGQYMTDPLTGQAGLSGRSAGLLSNEVFGRLYGDQGGVAGYDAFRFGASAGFRSGRVGEMIQEMSVRGMIRQADTRGLDLASDEGQRTALSRQADEITRAVKDRSRALMALNEIFGENGRPDAPMRELLSALEKFTAGSQQWRPERLEQVVRSVATAARETGISLDAVGMLQQGSIERLGSMGLSSAFAPQATMAGLTTRMAYSQMGAGGVNGFNRYSLDQLQVSATASYERGVGSTYANYLGAIGRVGRQNMLLRNAQGNQIRRIMGELDSGNVSDETYALLDSGRAGVISLLAGGVRGMDAGAATLEVEMLKASNQEEIHRRGVGDVMTGYQRREFIDKYLGGSTGMAYSNTVTRLQRLLGNTPLSGALASQITRGVATDFLDKLTEQDRANINDNTVRAKLAGMTRERLANIAAGGGPDAAAAARLMHEQSLNAIVNEQIGIANQEMAEKGFGTVGNAAAPFSGEAMEARRRAALRISASASMQSAAAAMWEGDPLLRGIQTLISRGDLKTAAGSVLGIDVEGKLAQTIAVQTKLLESQLESIGSDEVALGKMDPNSEAYRNKKAEIARKRGVYTAELGKLRESLDSNEELRSKVLEHSERLEKPLDNQDAPSADKEQQSVIHLHIGQLELNGETLTNVSGRANGNSKPSTRNGQPVGTN